MAPTIYAAEERPKPATRVMHKIRKREKKLRPAPPSSQRPSDRIEVSEKGSAVSLVAATPPRWSVQERSSRTPHEIKELEPRHLLQLKRWKDFLATNVDSERTRTLLEIALRTIELIERNRILNQHLSQLQLETRHFMASVMANPENKHLLRRRKP